MQTIRVARGKVIVYATEAELRAMQDNGMALYWTPGADEPYWAARANFTHDVCVAVPTDWLAAAGYDAWSEDEELHGEEGELLSLTLQRPPGDSDIITLQEASSETGLSRATLSQAAREGRLRARRAGGVWLVTRAALCDAIAAGKLRPRRCKVKAGLLR